MVIERTGKRWKGQIVLATMLILAGGTMCATSAAVNFATLAFGAGAVIGVALLVVGVVWLAWARLGAWWNHG